MDFIWNWLPWIGGSSVIALIVVALVAPSVLQVAAAWLTALSPLLKGIAEGLVEFAKSLWFGLKDMADNAKSILFVAVVATLAYLWGYYKAPYKTETVYVERKGENCTPVPVRKPTGSTLDDFFKNLGLPF
jgi:flagellar biosynthesis protein FlhB